MTFAGARPTAPEAEAPLPGRSHYFTPSLHLAGIPHFARLRYRNLYPGIDAVFHRSEYDFLIAPGADPAAIRLRFTAAPRLDRGDLVVSGLRHCAPLAYQDTAAGRRYIAVNYRIRGREVAFHLGPYDRTRPLVIDPVLVYATYLGGSAADSAAAVAVDSAGNAIVAGRTDSTDFPGAKGGNSTLQTGYIAKLDATGSNLLFATYLTGTTDTAIAGIALDAAGNIVAAGNGGFPPTAGASFFVGATGFVTKLSPAGDRILFTATFIAAPTALALDSKGAIYVTGSAGPAFKTTSGVMQPANAGGQCFSFSTGSVPCPDAFVLKLSADGAQVVYATFLGGNAEDTGRALTVDSGGAVYLAGDTVSANFPTTPGAPQRGFGGVIAGDYDNYGDAFVAKLDAAGANLVFSTFLGGAAPDIAYAIAADKNGSAYVAGSTQSANFPTTPGAFQTKYAGGTPVSEAADPAGDAFLVKYSPSGAVQWSTLLGGSLDDAAEAIAVDAAGNVYAAGTSLSSDFPWTAGAVRGCRAGGPFVAEFDPNGAKLLQTSSTGGMGLDQAHALALDSAGSSYLAGDAGSQVFFSTPAAAQKAYTGGDSDAFVARIDLAGSPKLFVSCLVNAASYLAGNSGFFPLGTVAPGEIVSLFGVNLGPTPAVGLQLTPGGSAVTTALGGTQVLFDGVPAPMLYAGPNQINAVVPYGVKPPVTQVTVQRAGATDGPRTLPVAAAVPAIFTADGSGIRQAAVLNQDGTYNSISNPAPAGTVITFYAEGAGLMNPPVADGSVTGTVLPIPQAPVTVQLRGIDTPVLYAGAAPGYVSGLLQVNVQIPVAVGFGNSIPLTMNIGGQASQLQVTVAVR